MPIIQLRLYKKKALILISVATVSLGALLVFQLLNTRVGFQYFEPTYLPPNVSIKAKRISTNSVRTMVEQDFRTADWVYSIREYKAISSIGTANQDYDPTSTKPTCSIARSPANRQYRLCHWIDYGRVNVYEVTFIKSGTFIQSQIPTTLQQQITVSEISKFVDSFKQRSTAGLPVLRSNV